MLLGNASTDDWNRQVLMPTAMAAQVPAFSLLGVGIVQARLVSILAIACATLAITVAVRSTIGVAAGMIAGVAFATSGLVLAYGRLVFLEPLVVAALSVAVAILVRPTRKPRLAGFLVGAAIVAAIGEKLLGLVPAVGIIAGAAWLARGRQADAPSFRWIMVGIGLAVAPWLLLLIARWDEVHLTASTLPALVIPGDAGALGRRIVSYFVDDNDNALALSLPLIAFAIAGTVAAIASFRTASRSSQALAITSLIWAALTVAELAMVTYRPNGYFVSALPALAMLGAFAVPPVLAALRGRPKPLRLGALAVLTALLAVQGVVATGPLSPLPPTTLPGLQTLIAQTLPAGQVVYGGYASTLAMTAVVPVITPWPSAGFNAGDLYETRGVRWVVLEDGGLPTWLEKHPNAWETREVEGCAIWGRHEVCLIHLGE